MKYGAVIASLLSILFGITIYLIIIELFGVNLVEATNILGKSFISPTIMKDFLIMYVMGCGLLLSFKAYLWNIDGKGQFYIAMIPSVIITLLLFNPETSSINTPAFIVVLLVIITGSIVGAVWATITGTLKVFINIDEVPVTLILNYIAYYLVNYLVSGPLKGKKTYGYLRTDEIPGIYRLNILPITWTGNQFEEAV